MNTATLPTGHSRILGNAWEMRRIAKLVSLAPLTVRKRLMLVVAVLAISWLAGLSAFWILVFGGVAGGNTRIFLAFMVVISWLVALASTLSFAVVALDAYIEEHVKWLDERGERESVTMETNRFKTAMVIFLRALKDEPRQAELFRAATITAEVTGYPASRQDMQIVLAEVSREGQELVLQYEDGGFADHRVA